MNLLKRIDNSILWLYKSNDYSANNLKKESEKRGVESSRIIFADRVSNDLHLSRIKCADLFLILLTTTRILQPQMLCGLIYQ